MEARTARRHHAAAHHGWAHGGMTLWKPPRHRPGPPTAIARGAVIVLIAIHPPATRGAIPVRTAATKVLLTELGHGRRHLRDPRTIGTPRGDIRDLGERAAARQGETDTEGQHVCHGGSSPDAGGEAKTPRLQAGSEPTPFGTPDWKE